jgi:hypothetical protein
MLEKLLQNEQNESTQIGNYFMFIYVGEEK